MDPRERELVFAKANINVVLAVRMYVRGKEKIRFQDKGNDAFDNSMDALAIISKYTKQDNLKMNAGIYNITSKIIEKSNSKQKKPIETKNVLV